MTYDEDELLTGVLSLAHELDVCAFHCHDSRYATGKGFPDLVLCGQRRTMFAELKSEFGRLDTAQTIWRYRLIASGQTWELWKPSDLVSGRIRREMEAL